MATVIVVREHTNGNYTWGTFLVDLLCLGIKDTGYEFNMLPIELKEFLESYPDEIKLTAIEYGLAHNIIYAGHDFAMEFHISPHRDFARITRYLLEEDDESFAVMDIATGDENGLPHLLVETPNEHIVALARLKQYAGEGNYRYTIMDEEEYSAGDEEDGQDNTFDIADRDKEDWVNFLSQTAPDTIIFYPQVIACLHLKAIAIPEFTKRKFDFEDMLSKAITGLAHDSASEEQTWPYSEKERRELTRLHTALFKKDPSPTELQTLVEVLQSGIRSWPTNPIFRNYLCNAYQLMGKKIDADRMTQEIRTIFPDYLYGKTLYA